MHKLLRFLLLLALITSLLIQCKQAEDPTSSPIVPSQDPIKPGVNVGLGAQLVPKADYEKISLIPDPLAGARLGVNSKNPDLPASYDLSVNTPPIGNQGMQGSCTAWAVAYAARSYFNKVAKSVTYKATNGTLNAETIFSPSFVYNQIKLGDCLTGGSYISTALDLVQNTGVCTLKDMPYNESDCFTQPTSDQKQRAAQFRIKGWGRVNITTSTFRKYLYFDFPIIITADLDDSFVKLADKDTSGEYLWKTFTTHYGYHAMVVVGYDDNRKAFKIQNSWSDRWANGGFIWLSYDLIGKAVREAYVMVTGDNPLSKAPKVQTGKGILNSDGRPIISGSITELGDEPIVKYGVCVSTKPELPTTQYEVDNKTITALPYSFTISPNLVGTRFYFRAFAQTTTTVVYGDTASVSITPTQSTSQTTGIGKNILLFYDSEAVALNADDGTIIWKTTNLATYGTEHGTGGVVAGNIFFVGGTSPRAFNLTDGKNKWTGQYVTGVSYTNTSFPLTNNSLIFNHVGPYLQAFDISSGALRWQLDIRSTGEESLESTSTVINNGTLYFRTYKNGQYSVYTVDASTGQQVQKSSVSNAQGNPLVTNTFLALRDNSIRTDGGLRGYSMPGFKQVWTSQSMNGFYPAGTNNLLIALEKRTFGDGKTYVIAIDQATGVQKWIYLPTQGTLNDGSMSTDGNSVAVTVSGPTPYSYKLQMLDAGTGKLRWEIDLQESPTSFTLVAGSKVYARTGDISPNTISAFDVNSGKQVWQSPPMTISPGPICLVTADGKTYYVPQSGMQQ